MYIFHRKFNPGNVNEIPVTSEFIRISPKFIYQHVILSELWQNLIRDTQFYEICFGKCLVHS